MNNVCVRTMFYTHKQRRRKIIIFGLQKEKYSSPSRKGFLVLWRPRPPPPRCVRFDCCCDGSSASSSSNLGRQVRMEKTRTHQQREETARPRHAYIAGCAAGSGLFCFVCFQLLFCLFFRLRAQREGRASYSKKKTITNSF